MEDFITCQACGTLKKKYEYKHLDNGNSLFIGVLKCIVEGTEKNFYFSAFGHNADILEKIPLGHKVFMRLYLNTTNVKDEKTGKRVARIQVIVRSVYPVSMNLNKPKKVVDDDAPMALGDTSLLSQG